MLKVSAKDFGPIIKGSVDLKPLTIFIGPSNSGKSYFAMLIYSLMQSFGPFAMSPYGKFVGDEWLRLGGLARRVTFSNMEDELEVTEQVMQSIIEWAKTLESTPRRRLDISFVNLPEEIRTLVEHQIKSLLQITDQGFTRELQRCHGAIPDIRSRRPDALPLRVGLEQDQPLMRLNFEEQGDSLKTLPDGAFDISQLQFEAYRGRMLHLLTRIARESNPPSELMTETCVELLTPIIQCVYAELLKNLPQNCYYLPAARSGIAQGHKVIASMLIRQSPFAAIRPLEIPTLPGITTDFMGHILTMERARGRRPITGMEEVVEFLERSVVHGSIDIERTGEITYPEITYAPFMGQPDMGSFPFHKTSSMVSELAPVILFLKYLVYPGDLVILEEPESHLHPASQRQMARGIVRLVNAGVKVILTTHSDYFVSQLNNLLRISYASDRWLKRENFTRVDCLKHDDVSAYAFRLDNAQGGSIVEELTIRQDVGIDDEEFGNLANDLYEETMMVQRIRPR